MVENLVSSYTCPFCNGKNISEQNIDIVGAAGNTVNIDMHCPSCDKHFMAKTEVIQMELWNFTADKIEKIKSSLSALKWKMWGDLTLGDLWSEIEQIESAESIKDDTISDLHKDLQKKWFNAADLFSDES